MINGNAGYVFFDAAPQLVLADADDALQDSFPHQQERRQRLHPGVPSKCLELLDVERVEVGVILEVGGDLLQRRPHELARLRPRRRELQHHQVGVWLLGLPQDVLQLLVALDGRHGGRRHIDLIALTTALLNSSSSAGLQAIRNTPGRNFWPGRRSLLGTQGKSHAP